MVVVVVMQIVVEDGDTNNELEMRPLLDGQPTTDCSAEKEPQGKGS
jgi:hypothetical protein